MPPTTIGSYMYSTIEIKSDPPPPPPPPSGQSRNLVFRRLQYCGVRN
jgi:hypothetical protein